MPSKVIISGIRSPLAIVIQRLSAFLSIKPSRTNGRTPAPTAVIEVRPGISKGLIFSPMPEVDRSVSTGADEAAADSDGQ